MGPKDSWRNKRHMQYNEDAAVKRDNMVYHRNKKTAQYNELCDEEPEEKEVPTDEVIVDAERQLAEWLSELEQVTGPVTPVEPQTKHDSQGPKPLDDDESK